jgi:hypothetical protein
MTAALSKQRVTAMKATPGSGTGVPNSSVSQTRGFFCFDTAAVLYCDEQADKLLVHLLLAHQGSAGNGLGSPAPAVQECNQAPVGKASSIHHSPGGGTKK